MKADTNRLGLGERGVARTPRGDLICKLQLAFKGAERGGSAADAQPSFERLLHFERRRGFHVSPAPAEGADEGVPVLNIHHELSDEDLGRVPKKGPVVAVVNHPFGGIEALVLAAMLRHVRKDVRVVADRFLEGAPGEDDSLFFGDPLERSEAAKAARRDCAEWVRNGGMLVLFPARGISRLRFRRRTIADPKWRKNTGRLIRAAEAPALPIFFSGSNGPLFQMLALIHYRLSSVVLRRELLGLRNKDIRIHVGSPIPFKRLSAFETRREMTNYLRMRTYILDHRTPERERTRRAGHISRARSEGFEPVAPPEDPERVAGEIAGLGPKRTLAETGEFAVILARAPEVPHVLRELGRLRESTFREVGEGTGKDVDLDRFDEYYHHLIVWNAEKRELVGAYRLGLTDEILPRYGRHGLYTSTLFKFKGGMLEEISPAIELGRSFVRVEYQRSYAPLMLLWKGIGAFVAERLRYKLLFGPVSINEEYNSTSRQLMIRFLEHNNYKPDLAKLVKARTPIHTGAIKGLRRIGRFFGDVEELSSLIADIETDQKGVPILLRQYLKLGGKLLGCNIDPDFSNVLDALVLVDLTETDPKILIRYMGKDNARKFLAHHHKSPASAKV